MRAWPTGILAGLVLMGAGCAKQAAEAMTREMQGSVFLQGQDGQAVRLALARVYFLRAQDLSDMAAEAARRRKHLAPAIEAARAALDAEAQRAKESEARPLELLNGAKTKLEEVKARNLGFDTRLWESDVQTANIAYMKVQLANLERLQPLLEVHETLATEASAAIESAETMPTRPVAEAGMTDANGEFSVVVPADADSVLVEANAGGARVVWLVPVAAIERGKPYLFSDHNRRR